MARVGRATWPAGLATWQPASVGLDSCDSTTPQHVCKLTGHGDGGLGALQLVPLNLWAGRETEGCQGWTIAEVGGDVPDSECA